MSVIELALDGQGLAAPDALGGMPEDDEIAAMLGVPSGTVKPSPLNESVTVILTSASRSSSRAPPIRSVIGRLTSK